ncbi:hypothetical protein Ct9H90mP29_18850 [bacterium]|nr:MAG: hypothetical protein Ct9H90mP29_18850 [bacterium]
MSHKIWETLVSILSEDKKPGDIVLNAELTMPDGTILEQELIKDKIVRIEVPYEPVKAILRPGKNMDIGAGPGQEIATDIYGGTVGLIFDGRDRPISIPSDPLKRLEALRSWSSALNEYPE